MELELLHRHFLASNHFLGVMFTFPAPWGSNIDSFGLVQVGYSDLEASQFLNQEDYDADVLIFCTLGSTFYVC